MSFPRFPSTNIEDNSHSTTFTTPMLHTLVECAKRESNQLPLIEALNSAAILLSTNQQVQLDASILVLKLEKVALCYVRDEQASETSE